MERIIKCIIVDDEHIAREILENHLKRIDGIKLVGLCKNAVEAFNLISSDEIDLVFLDINMPEISGLAFAKSINKKIKIIFTTAYREYAVDGFDLKAVDYLLKPISFDRIFQAVKKYENESFTISKRKPIDLSIDKNDFIFVKSERKMVKLNFTAVEYIESMGDYLKIYLHDKTIITRETITNIQARLPQYNFLRIHRSFIVSIKKIESFTNEFVEINKKAIPISRSYKNEVMHILGSI